VGPRTKNSVRCLRCRLPAELCICGLVPSLAPRTRVVIIMHHREHSRTTNTGHLARLCLGAEIHLRGLADRPITPATWFREGHQHYLLFPAPGIRLLDPEEIRADGRPVTLFVPDGNWRQASKVARRVPELTEVARVRLPPGARSRYRLRQETREEGLATIEAIARALGMLEGPEIQQQLEAVFDAMVERTLITRRYPIHARLET
jgi:DTW domain-containing protein YfiP